MTDDRRKFQFGLRKLLLWTAAVAVYLAVARTRRWDLAPFVVVTCWVAVVGGVRLALGCNAAALVSALGGAVLGGCLGWIAGRGSPALHLVAALFVGLMFFMFGCILFGILELAIRAVNWADGLFASSTSDGSDPGRSGSA